MSFLTLGIFRVGATDSAQHLARSDRSLSWIHLVFLFAVSITPFSTTLLAYWANIVLLGAALYFSWLGERRHAAADV